MSASGNNYARVRRAIGNGAQVVSHCDFRVANLFFGVHGQFAVIDWQLMNVNSPANDLAHLLVTNVDAELRRRQIENPMLEAFLAGLEAQGISDYQMEDLRADFAWHSSASPRSRFRAHADPLGRSSG